MKTHTSNFGKFASSIPCDQDGFTHTNIPGWLDAPFDHGDGRKPPKSHLREWAKEKARESRNAIQAANFEALYESLSHEMRWRRGRVI